MNNRGLEVKMRENRCVLAMTVLNTAGHSPKYVATYECKLNLNLGKSFLDCHYELIPRRALMHGPLSR